MTIIWTIDAKQRMKLSLAYCKKEFGKRVMLKYKENFKEQVELLRQQPYIGKIEPLLAERKESYRSLVIHRNFKLIYLVDEPSQIIYIVDMWDVRREPLEQAASLHL
jgi:plasmid stabilization system protein ParE